MNTVSYNYGGTNSEQTRGGMISIPSFTNVNRNCQCSTLQLRCVESWSGYLCDLYLGGSQFQPRLSTGYTFLLGQVSCSFCTTQGTRLARYFSVPQGERRDNAPKCTTTASSQCDFYSQLIQLQRGPYTYESTSRVRLGSGSNEPNSSVCGSRS
jgi:hypothetical protein